MSLLKKILPSLLIFLSSIIGLRVFNLFLQFNNRSEGSYVYSVREFDSCKKLRVAHPLDYEIFKPNKK